VQVGVAEAVDRLLGIANEERRQLAPGVDGVEDRELQRIGVLEFVISATGYLLRSATASADARPFERRVEV